MILRPSSAPRWSKCFGSASLELRFPEDEDRPEAREGVAAHWYATESLQGRQHPIGTLAPNGIPIDADMVEGGDVLVGEVLATKAMCDPRAALLVEHKLTMHGLIHSAVEGTPDVVLVDGPGHALYVWDYKYGHGYVDPVDNAQLVCYAAGAWEAYELDLEDVKGWRVELTIVQPRNYQHPTPVRTWKTLGWQVWRQIVALGVAANEATQPFPPTLTGSQCRDCRGQYGCEASRRTGSYGIDVAGGSAPDPLTPQVLGLELAKIDQATSRLEARRTSLAEVATAMIRRGERVPGWFIDHPPGREKWTVPAETVIMVGDAMGADLRKPTDAITPTQARKKVDATVIDAYAERPIGAAKLVQSNDRKLTEVFGER